MADMAESQDFFLSTWTSSVPHQLCHLRWKCLGVTSPFCLSWAENGDMLQMVIWDPCVIHDQPSPSIYNLVAMKWTIPSSSIPSNKQLIKDGFWHCGSPHYTFKPPKSSRQTLSFSHHFLTTKIRGERVKPIRSCGGPQIRGPKVKTIENCGSLGVPNGMSPPSAPGDRFLAPWEQNLRSSQGRPLLKGQLPPLRNVALHLNGLTRKGITSAFRNRV